MSLWHLYFFIGNGGEGYALRNKKKQFKRFLILQVNAKRIETIYLIKSKICYNLNYNIFISNIQQFQLNYIFLYIISCLYLNSVSTFYEKKGIFLTKLQINHSVISKYTQRKSGININKHPCLCIKEEPVWKDQLNIAANLANYIWTMDNQNQLERQKNQSMI